MTIQEKLNEIEREFNFEQMTKAEFVDFMSNLRNGSHTYGSMISLTLAKMNKKGNPYHNRVYKLSKWNFGCNTNYVNKAENIRDKKNIEGDFSAKGTYVQPTDGDNNFVVCYKKDEPTKVYLRVYTDANSQTPTFKEYYMDNQKVQGHELELVKGFIKNSVKGSQNLGVIGNDAFGTFNVGLDSVKYMFIDKRKIKIV